MASGETGVLPGWVSNAYPKSPGQQILFRGRFPIYSYMVTLRPLIRMNAIGPREIERFVQAVAGAKLSVREIELLAHGYFRGTPSLRQAIDQGRWKWTLDQMQALGDDVSAYLDFALSAPGVQRHRFTRELFVLMHKRHQRKTIIITSNLGFSQWGTFLKSPHLTSALNDRPTSTHHQHECPKTTSDGKPKQFGRSRWKSS